MAAWIAAVSLVAPSALAPYCAGSQVADAAGAANSATSAAAIIKTRIHLPFRCDATNIAVARGLCLNHDAIGSGVMRARPDAATSTADLFHHCPRRASS